MKKRYLILACLFVLALSACTKEPAQSGPIEGKTVIINTRDRSNDPTDAPPATPTPAITDSGSTPTPGVVDRQNGTFSEQDMNITINGINLSCGMDFVPYADKFGMEPTIERGQACLDEGIDVAYYYGNLFQIFTVEYGTEHRIYDIYVTGNGMGDGRGVVIGTTKRSEVQKIYGQPSDSMPGYDKYIVKTGVSMSIEYEDDVVTGIDYYSLGSK